MLCSRKAQAPRFLHLVFGDELVDLKLPDNVDSLWLSQGGRDMAAAYLLPRAEAGAIRAQRVLELPGHALMPGLVNSHGHAASIPGDSARPVRITSGSSRKTPIKVTAMPMRTRRTNAGSSMPRRDLVLVAVFGPLGMPPAMVNVGNGSPSVRAG